MDRTQTTRTMQESLKVEFYGIPRRRTGVPDYQLELGNGRSSISLGEVISKLAEKFLDFGADCVTGNQRNKLSKVAIANVNSDQFISDADFKIEAGQTLLILSADAGG